jgi:hypothetical protein
MDWVVLNGLNPKQVKIFHNFFNLIQSIWDRNNRTRSSYCDGCTRDHDLSCEELSADEDFPSKKTDYKMLDCNQYFHFFGACVEVSPCKVYTRLSC